MHPVPPRSSPSNIAIGKRVHPSDADALHHSCPAAADHQPALYTVWKRSSMGFQGTDGFSVYDAAGALAFRVDNYSRRRKLFAGELLLMDGHGAPLLALRPQVISYSNSSLQIPQCMPFLVRWPKISTVVFFIFCNAIQNFSLQSVRTL